MTEDELDARVAQRIAAGEPKVAARLLRDHGWSYLRIGEVVCADAATVHRWLNPESAERNRAWHRRKWAETKRGARAA